jgi:hypothetical protein
MKQFQIAPGKPGVFFAGLAARRGVATSNRSGIDAFG